MPQWSDEEAQRYCQNYKSYGQDLALRVYTTRLLGRDPALVLHGGGNTSVKTIGRDELGREVPVLCVKGSGWDMGDIEPAGLPSVCLEPIQDFRALDTLSDEAMVNGVRRHLLDSKAPNPSVETLLHAFLPHKFIDHTHADAVLALADQENAEALCRQVFGSRMGIVPYIMPGFALSKKAVEVYEQDPDVEGLILINHGIFTFGPTARIAYERMLDMVKLAEDHIQSCAVKPFSFAPLEHQSIEPVHGTTLAVLRGCLSGHEEGIGSVVLHGRTSSQIEAFLNRPDLKEISARGPATPDHVIRTKQRPLVLANPELANPEEFRAQLKTAIQDFVNNYKAYFQTQMAAKGESKKQVHPLPVVFLIRGIGLVTAGKTTKAARIAADIYEHTIDTILKAEAVGRYYPLPDDHLFDMEYWSLEQAKLGKNKPKPLAGKVTLISGAAGGIGQAVARVFAEAGSNLVLTDQEAQACQDLADSLRKQWGIGVDILPCNLTKEADVAAMIEQACHAFGGIDILISNAGVAPTGPIDQASDAMRKSLEINLLAHQYLSAAVAKTMVAQGTGGCLLFNASKSAFNPGPGFGAYSIPKAALIALMKQYAVEFAGHGIRSLAVNADRIRTPLLDETAIAKRAAARGLKTDDYFRANLLGTEVLADDVARAFYHLQQSRKTTAAVFTVDGGNIAASPR